MILTTQEVLQVRILYEPSSERRNYEEIDKLLAQLKFFKKFNKSTRMSLLKISEYLEVPPGKTIHKEGDQKDKIFVIVRGAVTLKIVWKIENGETTEDRVASFYDGEHFGEVNIKDWTGGERKQELMLSFNSAMQDRKKKVSLDKKGSVVNPPNEDFDQKIKEKTQEVLKKNERITGTLETSESSILLTIPGEGFRSIFESLQKKELEQRLELLKGLTFLAVLLKETLPEIYLVLLIIFSKTQSLTDLVPLANLLQSKIFKFGEVIIREGEIPQGAFIVAKGALRVIVTKNTPIQKFSAFLYRGHV